MLTSKAALRSPGCEKLAKLHPLGPVRLPLFPNGHPVPTLEADIGHDLSDIMIVCLAF